MLSLRITTILTLTLYLASIPLGFADKKPSAELTDALAAADRARALPTGEAYVKAAQVALHGIIYASLRDCMGHVPGWRQPSGFDSVLIIGSNGRLKWMIRDARDPMTTCILSKVVTVTFPKPPADNWPIKFGIHSRH